MPDSETSTPAKPVLRLVPLDAARPDLAGVITDLHLRLLPTSPATLLGTQFLRDFYYTFLPARFMYFGMGWRLSRTAVPGWRTPSVEFEYEVKQ